MVNNCLSLEGQRQYKNQQELLWKTVDIGIDDPKEGYRQRCEIPWYKHIECFEDNLYKLPEVSSLPMWEVKIDKDKESKMYLTQLSPPDTLQCDKMRAEVRKFLSLLDLPTHAVYPEEEDLRIPSKSFCYTERGIYEDRDAEAYGFGPCLYQSFMTGFDSPRECWLPSPEYKRSSRFWSIVTRPIVDLVGYSCLNKTDTEIWNLLKNRIEPAVSFDLKGSGLQFPLEYLIIVAEELARIYPDLEEETSRMTNLLNNLQVIKDNKTIDIKRGPGLGYYTNLKSIALWSIMRGLKIKASFDDDLLVAEEHFTSVLDRCLEYGFIVNDKKTGKRWNNVYWFIEAGISQDGLVTFSTEQADIAAIFRQRFYYERKQLVSSLENEIQLLVAYHLERFYGHEFRRKESLLSIEEGGYCTTIPVTYGISRGAFAVIDKRRHEVSQFKIAADLYPSELLTLSERKDIHKTRKSRWKSGRSIHTYDHSLLERYSTTKIRLSYYDYPVWAEACINMHDFTSGNQVGDYTEEEIIGAFIDYRDSPDPIAWLSSKDIYEPRLKTTMASEPVQEALKIKAMNRYERRMFLKDTYVDTPRPLDVEAVKGLNTGVVIPTLEHLLSVCTDVETKDVPTSDFEPVEPLEVVLDCADIDAIDDLYFCEMSVASVEDDMSSSASVESF